MNNYNPTEMLAEEMTARMTAANREIGQLRADLAAATARAEAAEARVERVDDYASYYNSMWWQMFDDPDLTPLPFEEWLAQQEVQP